MKPCQHINGPRWAAEVHKLMNEAGVACPGEEKPDACPLNRLRGASRDEVVKVAKSA